MNPHPPAIEKTYPVAIEKTAILEWWWHVVGTEQYGYTLTEAGARRKAAQVIAAQAAARRRPKLEQWTLVDAERVLGRRTS